MVPKSDRVGRRVRKYGELQQRIRDRQRPGGIIVMIEEIHGRPVKAGESFSAAHIVGYFDDIESMHAVYDQHRGHTALEADASGWKLK